MIKRFRSPPITRQNARASLQAHGVGAVRLGNYGGDNPSGYSEEEVFTGTSTEGMQAGGAQPRPFFRNNTYATLYPFSFSRDRGSVSLIPANERRVLLIIQNQAASGDGVLYVNFGNAAKPQIGLQLTEGAGIIIDYQCPANAIYVYMDADDNQPGVIIEAAPTF